VRIRTVELGGRRNCHAYDAVHTRRHRVRQTLAGFFFIASAALLSRYRFANLWLPTQIRNRRVLAFVAHGLVLTVLSIVAVHVVARITHVSTFSPRISDPFFYMGLVISVVLAYQFMDKSYFLNTPKLRRRLMIAAFSLVVVIVPAFAVVIAVIGLFIIK
jgi:hypothetical protein